MRRQCRIAFVASQLLLATALVLGSSACTRKQSDSPLAERVESTTSNQSRGADVLAVAASVLEAVEAQDGSRLASLAHAAHGVRFTPYAFVDIAQDRVLDRSELETLWQDEHIHTWGSFDGSGDPIQMTGAQYVGRFVIDRDFSKATAITVNSQRARGNTADNSAEVYPHSSVVEYYVEPTDGTAGMDWAALRLVLELYDGEWKLVGVIHDEWTI